MPHDKIYSLLSLAKDRHGIPVDYNCTPQQLLVRVLSQKGWNRDWHIWLLAKALGVSESTKVSKTVTVTHRISSLRFSKDTAVQMGLRTVRPANYPRTLHLQKQLRPHRCWGLMEHSSLAVCEDGSIAVVCSNAKTGDLLCDFGGDKIFVVTQESSGGSSCRRRLKRESIIGTASAVLDPTGSTAWLTELQKFLETLSIDHSSLFETGQVESLRQDISLLERALGNNGSRRDLGLHRSRRANLAASKKRTLEELFSASEFIELVGTPVRKTARRT